jgi:hypothetical protein
VRGVVSDGAMNECEMRGDAKTQQEGDEQNTRPDLCLPVGLGLGFFVRA